MGLMLAATALKVQVVEKNSVTSNKLANSPG
jgi:hypothetical protein